MYVVRHRRGLGLSTAGPVSAAGIAKCAGLVDSGDYWLSPTCWFYSPSAWIQMRAFQNAAPTNLTTPPVGPSTVAQETQPGAFTPDQALTATEQAAQTAAVQQMSQVPDVPEGGGSTGLPILDWIGNLFGGGGEGSTPSGLSTTAKVAIGLAAGVGLLVLTASSGGRRRR